MLRAGKSPVCRLKPAANGDFATAGLHVSPAFPDGEDNSMRVSSSLQLLEPNLEYLSAYADALARGWSPNSIRDVSGEQLDAIAKDRQLFVAALLSQAGTAKLPDGTEVPRLPNRVRWLWDGQFAGHIGLRWQAGTDALPDYVLGHIGVAVVPWKRRRGYATEALAQMLPLARKVGLKQVQITTEPSNFASRRVIEANGGRLVGEFINPRFGIEPKLRYVIDLEGQ
jgi:predicted acetyltransferase